MKRTILFLLAFMVVMVAWADDITAQQALQQAQSFIKQRETAGSRPKRIKGTAAKLTMVKQVSGLYLFNVNDEGGFVVVSNDDCTRPILGFSDSGSLDPDNMPSNMRAWLQGYADEIAWAKQHNIAKATNAGKAASTGPVKAPHRVGSHSTVAIDPLVATKWDQDAPFNNMTPYYYINPSTGAISYSATGGSGYEHCVTGCVATAMAQVMKYHEWPRGETTSIPSYQWGYAGFTLSSLSATTFDWANMLDVYPYHYENYKKISDCTTAQADAVATLMKYCGWSVQMNYGRSSSSNSVKLTDALINYFDYNKNTTQCVSRSLYTAAKWADLIYYELAHSRPVVYGGQSSGGGHEFVCDGYKYESGTDFFHINWGWGGQSDNYFVLSALDPDSQGIGGSSSTDGYHYGQDAVIGIQPSTSSEPTANITPIDINLMVNSITSASNPTVANMEVNITLNITNNSSDDYDGDIYIGQIGYGLLVGNSFMIAAGETKDVVLPFTPTSAGTYNLVAFLPNGSGTYYAVGGGQLSLEVTPTNEYVPVYGYYCDELSNSQFIIPAANLEDMTNATVNGVTFYSTDQSVSWGNAKFDVYLQEVSETTLSSLKDWNSLEKVYSGSLSISDGKMEISFDDSYQYNGGNLLVGINQTTSGNYVRCFWIGTTLSGASIGGYNENTSQQNFLPTTTFDYTHGAGSTPKPQNITVTPAATSASVTWTNNSEYAMGYNLRYRTAAKVGTVFEDDFENGLDEWTIYTEGEYGNSNGWFITNPNNGLNIAPHGGSYVASAWSWNNSAYNADNWLITPQVVLGNELRFWVYTNPNYPDSYEVLLSTTGKDISNFTFTLQAMAPASQNGQWNEVVIDLSDYEGMQGYIAIHHVDYDKNYLLIDDFGIYGNAAPAGEWQTVSTTQKNKVVTGLTPLTTYELQLQGVYAEGTSDWSSPVTFTTLEQSVVPGDANGDGSVTFADVMAIVNYLLGKPSGAFVLDGADFNNDGKVTISDAVGVLYYLNAQ